MDFRSVEWMFVELIWGFRPGREGIRWDLGAGMVGVGGGLWVLMVFVGRLGGAGEAMLRAPGVVGKSVEAEGNFGEELFDGGLEFRGIRGNEAHGFEEGELF